MLAPGAVGGRGGLGPGSEGTGGRGISFESALFCKMKSKMHKIVQTIHISKLKIIPTTMQQKN